MDIDHVLIQLDATKKGDDRRREVARERSALALFVRGPAIECAEVEIEKGAARTGTPVRPVYPPNRAKVSCRTLFDSRSR